MACSFLFIPWYTALLPRRLSKQTDDEVHNNGQQNADYDTGRYREEKLKVAFSDEYIAGESSQEGKSLPRDE